MSETTIVKPVADQPALLLEREAERVLVVADLHLGWEVSLSHQGIHVPSQVPRLLEKLRKSDSLLGSLTIQTHTVNNRKNEKTRGRRTGAGRRRLRYRCEQDESAKKIRDTKWGRLTCFGRLC